MNANGQSSVLAALKNHPWRNHDAGLSNPPPTMLDKQVLNLLHWLAANYFQAEGAIIDAGCFLGGSTQALAAGLAQNTKASAASALIHSYDLFTTTGQPWIDNLKQFELPTNQSFEDKFRKNVAQHAGRIEVHAGNLLEQSWGSAPIEILFLDICKSPELHDHATRMWFPRLIPGRSIVIQQDYGWAKSYWCNVMMEVFRDHFEVLDDVPVASRVYLCTKAISDRDAAEKVFAHLSAEDKLRHMEAAVASADASPFRDYLLLNHALLAENLGLDELVGQLVFCMLKQDKAEKVAAQVIRRFPKHFVGPDTFSLDNLTDPKLTLICQTSMHERLCLFSLVASLQPKRVLEIGRARGGSTMIIANALKQVPDSKFVSLDPNTLPLHSISPHLVERLSSSVTFIDGYSPADNPKACIAAGGKFDFVFIDANHYYKPCLADIHGVIPFLNDNAVILFHDAHFLGVKEAIHTALEQEPSLSDCGLVSTAACYSLAHQDYLGEPSIFGGLYMLRFNSQRRARNYRLDQVEESPRRQGRQQQGKRPRLPFFRRVRREFNRVLGRKLEM